MTDHRVPTTGAPRPNVLFVITDQQRGAQVAFAGNTILRTPQYTRQSTGEEQLFDFAADHDEVAECSGSADVRRAEMMERLADALIADDDPRGASVAV